MKDNLDLLCKSDLTYSAPPQHKYKDMKYFQGKKNIDICIY